MGQQQLLLLVLSTVIVGLATVAGIQAFSENQAQATEDALTQRAISVATDIRAADGEPTQFGGVNFSNSNQPSASDVKDAIGLSSNPFDADGAGDNAQCELATASGSPATATVTCVSSNSDAQDVEVTYDKSNSNVSGSDVISTSYGDKTLPSNG